MDTRYTHAGHHFLVVRRRICDVTVMPQRGWRWFAFHRGGRYDGDVVPGAMGTTTKRDAMAACRAYATTENERAEADRSLSA